MADSSQRYRLIFSDSIDDIDAASWNALAGTEYPFLRHEFLRALEETGCTSPATGWRPCHVRLLERRGDGQEVTAALAPMFLKYNSLGEYVFDWSWADAYYQHGMDYYPKLVCAAPFTPCSGPRLFIDNAADTGETLRALTEGIREQAESLGASGWHILFPVQTVSDALADLDIQQRLGCQYHWFNDGFQDYEHFLAKFSSRKRKNLRKERRRVSEAGITFERLRGGEISPDLWHTFYRFYERTYLVRGRRPYLNPGFFLRVGELMPEQVLLVMARRDGEYIAGALSFQGSDTLYGRYWGCLEEYEFLHFETCFYQGIDHCIDTGLERFDSGAQGEHKIQRGFEPVFTYSNHWIAHPGFNQAIGRFLREEEHYVREFMDRASELLPFKQEEGQAKP